MCVYVCVCVAKLGKVRAAYVHQSGKEMEDVLNEVVSSEDLKVNTRRINSRIADIVSHSDIVSHAYLLSPALVLE